MSMAPSITLLMSVSRGATSLDQHRHSILFWYQCQLNGHQKPSTPLRPSEPQESDSGVRLVPHGNPQLHPDQPDQELFCLWTESGRFGTNILLLSTFFFFLVPKFWGTLLNPSNNNSCSSRPKQQSPCDQGQVLVAMGHKIDSRIRFLVSWGSRGRVWFCTAIQATLISK